MFIDGGLLIKNSGEVPEVSSVDDFVGPRQQLVDSVELSEFSETEQSHRDERFRNVAHRLMVSFEAGQYSVVLERQAREGTNGLSTGDIDELKRLPVENAEPRM